MINILCTVGYKYHMKIIILLTILILICKTDRRIISRPIRSIYNQYGEIQQIVIQWKCYQPLFENDFFKIILPETIHDSSISLIISFSLETAYSKSIITNQDSLPYVGSNTYYLPVSANLSSSIWYQLSLHVTKSLTIVYGLIQLQVVSGQTSSPINYVWNNGFEYFHLEEVNLPMLNIFSIKINNTLSAMAGNRYTMLVQVQSTITVNNSVPVTFDFVGLIANSTNFTISTVENGANMGFSFVGSCYSRCDYGNTYHSCIHSEKCQVSSTQVTVTLPYMISNQRYLIEMYVMNPSYASTVGIQAYWKDSDGKTAGIAFANQILEVTSIKINPEGINLLWGIPYDTVVNEMQLGLIVNDPSSKHQSLATFDIGFSVDQVTPIQSQYEVRLKVGATSVLQNSIVHNLPKLKSSTIINCRYILPEIVCTGVDAFYFTNYRYFIKARGYFTTADDLSGFGDVIITSKQQPKNLFINLQRNFTNITTILNSDYHDYGGLHEGTQNFRISQTLVTSFNDTLLPNSTTKSIQNFLTSNSSLVGIDTKFLPQQLLFFLNVKKDQMSLPSPTSYGQNYTMKIFTNPNVMNSSNLGIDFVAYSATNKIWTVEDASCYINSYPTPITQSFQCQKYNDYVYSTQVDNTFTHTPSYGLYTFTCGHGELVTCPSGDCSDSCRIFQGGFTNSTMITGSAGVFSIRNVTFPKNYHSPVEAGPNNLDFVIAFYQNGTFVSCTLINAYTINQTRLQNVRADLINYYYDNTTSNIGNRIPTLLKISGYLTLQEAGTNIISSIRVHLPSIIAFNNFIQTSNNAMIGCSTNNCIGFIGGTTGAVDNWNQENCVTISSLPSLTQNFILTFPVTYSSYIVFPSITISFVLSNGQIGGVFRINGSSSSESLVGNMNYIAKPWNPSTAWNPSSPLWVNQPSLYQFSQAINISAIAPFSPFNTINMGITVMPSTDTAPSTTFTSSYLNIFSNYTNPLVDNTTKCLNPFPYTYMNSYKVWVLWCPIKPGSTNQIVIKYPLYPDSFGANFPFNLIFTYAYANTLGAMIGYRTQQNTGGSSQQCSVTKTTTYNTNSKIPQENTFVITVTPFKLSADTHNNFLVSFSIPSQIPISILSCVASQSSQNVPMNCTIYSQTLNLFHLEITSAGPSLSIYQLTITLKSLNTSIATISSLQQFNISVILPFTLNDGNSTIPSLKGNLFAPFYSLISKCSSVFSYISSGGQQYIFLTQPKISALSSNYYGNLSFLATFSGTRSTLFQTSSIVITFSQPILTPNTMCSFYPPLHAFFTSTISPNMTIMTLAPPTNISGFTDTPYTIHCTQIITNGNNINASVTWIDGIYTFQSTSASAIFPHTGINNITSTISGSIVNKNYNTPAYLGQYTLSFTLSTTATSKMQIYIDFYPLHIHSSFLECQYLVGSIWKQILCIPTFKDTQSEAYIEFVAISSPTVQLKIYGIMIANIIPPTIKALIKIIDINTNAMAYYTSNIVDTPSIALMNDPIIINSYSIDTNTMLTLTYSLPIAYSSGFYLRIDEIFRIPPNSTVNCTINNTDTICQRIRPDIIFIQNTLPHAANSPNTLTVSTFSFFYAQQYDTEQVRFSLFILNNPSTNTYVIYGSHDHTASPLLTSSLTIPQSLIWKIPNNKFYSLFHIVYVGYFGPPVTLVSTVQAFYKQSFAIQYLNSVNFTMMGTDIELGTNYQQVYMGVLDPSYLGYTNILFVENSTYYSVVPSLPVYISSEKCTLTPEFSSYNIINGGITIPIAISVANCRPMDTMTISTTINNSYISAEPTFSTKTINSSSSVIYIVLSYSLSTTNTIGLFYHLKVSLHSDDPIVNNSYNQILNITINVINGSQLIGNPEGKQPILNSVTQSSVNLTLQCNTPATIYWGIGIYPTMLGITVSEIQARLTSSSNGLLQSNSDIYSWSQELYGLDYVNDFNIQRNLIINSLHGGLQYVYKYFCVDQTGTASGGKILLINTLASNYSLVKVSLGYTSLLTFSQVNSIACALSEQLTITYSESMSSLHSNCFNNTQIFFKNNETYYDQKNTPSLLSSAPYSYFFYINTNKLTTRAITTTLSNKLGQNKIFLNAVLPYYSSLRVDPLLNNYEPIIKNIIIDIKMTQFVITANVGLQNTYLIAALMNKVFDPKTMSLPTDYLMKQGYFSIGSKFNQIFSIYGRGGITATFSDLLPGHHYTVFYFATVDNPALNSRNSPVQYQVLVTNIHQIVDLNQQTIKTLILMAFVSLILLLN